MIRVLIVDDSATGRDRLSALLAAAADIEVVGAVGGERDVVGAIAAHEPDLLVMTLDLPPTDGLSATRSIMRDCPLPIVLMSTMPVSAALEQEAKRAGALAVVERPDGTEPPANAAQTRGLIAAVRTMAGVAVIRHWHKPRRLPRAQPGGTRAPLVIAIAASTGGPAALKLLLSDLSPSLPCPILLVQHMSTGRIDRFAAWLDAQSPLRVGIAQDGAHLQPGEVYVAPEEAHLGIRHNLTIELCDGDPIDGFCPSASYLFQEAAKACASRTTGVILTGMGRDGVDGLAAIKARRGTVIAQDEKSCAVFGMPKAAAAAGVVDHVLPLGAIADRLNTMCGIEKRDTQCVY
jgi:two-component system chemotaxis response regulator CheB